MTVHNLTYVLSSREFYTSDAYENKKLRKLTLESQFNENVAIGFACFPPDKTIVRPLNWY